VTPTTATSLYPNPAKDAAILDMGYMVTTGLEDGIYIWQVVSESRSIQVGKLVKAWK
jgi:hypothetical protein